MTLRLSETQAAALRETAEQEGRSMHEVVELAIDDYVGRHARRRDALIERIMAEDREALDRLGSV